MGHLRKVCTSFYCQEFHDIREWGESPDLRAECGKGYLWGTAGQWAKVRTSPSDPVFIYIKKPLSRQGVHTVSVTAVRRGEVLVAAALVYGGLIQEWRAPGGARGVDMHTLRACVDLDSPATFDVWVSLKPTGRDRTGDVEPPSLKRARVHDGANPGDARMLEQQPAATIPMSTDLADLAKTSVDAPAIRKCRISVICPNCSKIYLGLGLPGSNSNSNTWNHGKHCMASRSSNDDA